MVDDASEAAPREHERSGGQVDGGQAIGRRCRGSVPYLLISNNASLLRALTEMVTA